ncbi:phosphatase PAP2 family protein [Spirosoma sp. SC4-14]|uniref:phosphatase PAP2 family protein n=1 Tax=Spirosoma sp. SC4-14 TaxID=3128900 RepID=UPI0030D3BEF9
MTTRQLRQYLYRHGGSRASDYPKLVEWVARRLSTDHFQGLPLTVLMGLLVGNVLVLSEIAENLVKSEPMVKIDALFTQGLVRNRTPLISHILYALTWLGSFYMTIGLTLAGSFFLYRQQKKRNIIILWVMLAGVGTTVQLGKRTFSRARPQQVAYYPETGYSFPSGHSATAMTLYGLLGYWLVRGRHRLHHPVRIGVLAAILILAVGFSRIYLGVHFLSDVLGGYLLGACWLLVGIVLSEWQRQHT